MADDLDLADRLQQEREVASDLAAELARQPLIRQKWLVRNHRRFCSFGLVEHLLGESRKQWHGNPERAEKLAELGLVIAELLDEGVYGAGHVNDLRARAWSYIANARRIRSNLRSVEEAFQAAEFYLAKGSGDPEERVSLLSLEASLRRDQRRFDDAAALLEEAAQIHQEAGNVRQQALVRVQQATVLSYSGRHDLAVDVLRATLKLIESERESRLLLYANHNLALCLNEMGRTEEALDLLPAVRELSRRTGEALDRLRGEWLEGLVLVKAGRYEEGEKLLLHARDRFVELGIGYDAASLSMELALLYLRTGRPAEAKQLATQLVPIFESRDLNREALNALLVLQKALQKEEATVDLVTDVAEFLDRSRSNPRVRFQPSGGY